MVRRGVVAGIKGVQSTFRHHAHTLARRYSLRVARLEDESSIFHVKARAPPTDTQVVYPVCRTCQHTADDKNLPNTIGRRY